MTTDPDEIAQRVKDPIRILQSVEWTLNEVHRGVKSLKLVGWVIAVLLVLILWRVWN